VEAWPQSPEVESLNLTPVPLPRPPLLSRRRKRRGDGGEAAGGEVRVGAGRLLVKGPKRATSVGMGRRLPSEDIMSGEKRGAGRKWAGTNSRA